MSRRAKNRHPVRNAIVLLCFLGGFVMPATRAVYLQVFNSDFLQSQGNARHSRLVKGNSPRGMNLHRNRQPLAIRTPVGLVMGDPPALAAGRGKGARRGRRAGPPGDGSSRAPARPLLAQLDLQLDLGQHFVLKGRGLDARLTGKLGRRADEDRLPTASGGIRVAEGDSPQLQGRRLLRHARAAAEPADRERRPFVHGPDPRSTPPGTREQARQEVGPSGVGRSAKGGGFPLPDETASL